MVGLFSHAQMVLTPPAEWIPSCAVRPYSANRYPLGGGGRLCGGAKDPILEGMTPPGGWTQAFIEHLGIELWRIPVVVASAVGIYLTFLLLVRVFGVRVLSGWTGFDAVVLIMLGSVAGRVIIGHPPTLAAGPDVASEGTPHRASRGRSPSPACPA